MVQGVIEVVLQPPSYYSDHDTVTFILVVICGDMNLDLIKYPNNKLTNSLQNLGFSQLVNETTHIQGGIIDHVYFYSPQHAKCTLYKIHPLYYSDHDAVTFLLDNSLV